MNFTEYALGIAVGLCLGILMLPITYWLVWEPLGKFWRGWRLHIQTADDLERAVRRELDKRWRDLETERRMKILTLEVEERMTRERGAATHKRS